jgi:hypothetical protein
MTLPPEVMVAAGYEMRVSDAEREAAATELREHFASGRLNSDELEERLSAAFAARTRGDLDALFTDLPTTGHGWDGAGQAGGRQQAPPWAGAGNQQWQERGAAWGASAGRTAARIAVASVLVPVLLILGVLGVFGIGTGRPLGIVLLLAAFALLRKLLVIIFSGRRRAPVGRRPCGPRGRRW